MPFIRQKRNPTAMVTSKGAYRSLEYFGRGWFPVTDIIAGTLRESAYEGVRECVWGGRMYGDPKVSANSIPSAPKTLLDLF
ncbi:MAG: hypothetical protein ACLQNE_39575 [Thermoguttaceae bacterium]